MAVLNITIKEKTRAEIDRRLAQSKHKTLKAFVLAALGLKDE